MSGTGGLDAGSMQGVLVRPRELGSVSRDSSFRKWSHCGLSDVGVSYPRVFESWRYFHSGVPDGDEFIDIFLQGWSGMLVGNSHLEGRLICCESTPSAAKLLHQHHTRS